MTRKKKTTCPKCDYEFNIENRFRTYQIRRKYAPFWFFDAIKQFEHFNEIECPSCGHTFKAREARLLFFFSSPYTLVLICTLLMILLIVLLLKLK